MRTFEPYMLQGILTTQETAALDQATNDQIITEKEHQQLLDTFSNNQTLIDALDTRNFVAVSRSPYRDGAEVDKSMNETYVSMFTSVVFFAITVLIGVFFLKFIFTFTKNKYLPFVKDNSKKYFGRYFLRLLSIPLFIAVIIQLCSVLFTTIYKLFGDINLNMSYLHQLSTLHSSTVLYLSKYFYIQPIWSTNWFFNSDTILQTTPLFLLLFAVPFMVGIAFIGALVWRFLWYK